MVQKPASEDQVLAIPLLLTCPNIHHLPTVVTAVVEEGLIELLMGDSCSDDWFDDGWYYGHLRERLWDAKGNIILAAHGEELWDFMLDPDAGFVRYSNQIEAAIMSFYSHNEGKINSLYHGYEVKSVKTARAFKNQWLMLAQGVKI